jgi:hypothetical protein
MTPIIFTAALSMLATSVTGVTVPGQHPLKFDDTQMEIIHNGGDPNQVLCADRAIVGSRFVRHICYTRGQWSELKDDQHYHTDRMMRRLNEEGGLGGGGLGDPKRPPGANNPP